METAIFGRHIFSERLDPEYNRFYRFYKKQNDERLAVMEGVKRMLKGAGRQDDEVEQTVQGISRAHMRRCVIVRYPHAVSCFESSAIAPWFEAEALSKHRKDPAMSSHVYAGSRKPLIAWAVEGRCIFKLAGDHADPRFGGPETVIKKLPHLFANDPSVVALYDTLSTLEYIMRLEKEIGLFIGSVPLEDFLASCTLKKETDFARVYFSERL